MSPYSISAKRIVQEVVALYSISTAGIELNIYTRVWVMTIEIVKI